MTIDLVYITKNEEKNIAKSIESCLQIVDRVIVVDTGSTDNTREIAADIGAEVYHYEWVDDFSAARNYALSLCDGDVILCLDADEYFEPALTPENKTQILNTFESNPDLDVVGFYKVDIEKSTGKKNHTLWDFKFIRRTSNLKYKNKIHEYLIKENNKPLTGCGIPNMVLYHTGYSADCCKEKVARNLSILKQIENPSTMDLYYLGRENFNLQNYTEAIEYFNKFFNCPDIKEVIATNNIAYLAYIYLSRAYGEEKQEEKAKEVLKQGIAKHPYVPEFYYRLGLIEYRSNLKTAKKLFLKAEQKEQELRETQPLILDSFLGYSADLYYRLAKISFFERNMSDCRNYSAKSCLLNHGIYKYEEFYVMCLSRSYEDNLQKIRKILAPSTREDYDRLVNILAKTNLYKEFVTIALEYNNQFQGNSIYLYWAMLLCGQYSLCLETLIRNTFEQKDLFLAVSLLYINNETLYTKYIDNLSSKYRKVVDCIISGDYTTLKDGRIISKMFYWLVSLGVNNFPKSFTEAVISLSSEKEMQEIFSVYTNNGNYQNLLCLYEKHILKDPDLSKSLILNNEVLMTLFLTGEYEKFINGVYDLFRVNYEYYTKSIFGKILPLISKNSVTKTSYNKIKEMTGGK